MPHPDFARDYEPDDPDYEPDYDPDDDFHPEAGRLVKAGLEETFGTSVQPPAGDSPIPDYVLKEREGELPVVKPAGNPPAPPTVTSKALPPTSFSPQSSSSGDAGARWVCSGCGATWKADPGPWHTHEHPVAGSKNRVTYENKAINRVG